jgi:hypothetical protein
LLVSLDRGSSPARTSSDVGCPKSWNVCHRTSALPGASNLAPCFCCRWFVSGFLLPLTLRRLEAGGRFRGGLRASPPRLPSCAQIAADLLSRLIRRCTAAGRPSMALFWVLALLSSLSYLLCFFPCCQSAGPSSKQNPLREPRSARQIGFCCPGLPAVSI